MLGVGNYLGGMWELMVHPHPHGRSLQVDEVAV